MIKGITMAEDFLQEYRKFISQIEVLDVKLVMASVENKVWPALVPTKLEIKLERKPEFTNEEAGFTCVDSYIITGVTKGENREAVKLSAKFGVTYSSKTPMREELFKEFGKGNLVVHTWPYLREFAHNTFARMGVFNLVVPSMKLGIKEPSRRAKTKKALEPTK